MQCGKHVGKIYLVFICIEYRVTWALLRSMGEAKNDIGNFYEYCLRVSYVNGLAFLMDEWLHYFMYISAEDFARISGYGDIVKMISSAPVLPQWSYGMWPNY